MKVLFNVQSLLPPRTGIGLYTQHLIEALTATGELDAVAGFLGGRIYRGEALHAYVNEDRSAHAAPALMSPRGRLAALKVAIRGVPGAYAARQALREWQDGRRIGVLAREGFVYHEPNYVPVRYAGPLVITAHDLSHVRYPQFHPVERVAFLNKHLASALARADRVVTDSHFVAGELAEVYGIPAGKLFVTHLGADADFRVRTSEEVAETLKAFGLRYRGFVLSVATLEPRKNVERLGGCRTFQAFA
ncbi:glycosyltransferase [Thiomonas intermedia]|uniref:glycosyltransferase n=1 Tax=Thiomonas intermedia TaxID=926 RepID=UPI0012AC3610|nr:glycosyltransferase [Thiomonas intermedia]